MLSDFNEFDIFKRSICYINWSRQKNVMEYLQKFNGRATSVKCNGLLKKI